VPMHCVIRIDEVQQQGRAKIMQSDGEQKIRHFPAPLIVPPQT